MNLSLFLSLTFNGLVYGLLLFCIAAGLALIFGLMGVLNFAHASLFTWGAYVGFTVYTKTSSLLLAAVAAAGAGALLGMLIERAGIRRLYGRHMDQILLTLGLLLVLDQLVIVVWGPSLQGFLLPAWAAGSWTVAGTIFPIYRVVLGGVGLVILLATVTLLHRTRIGITVRAGVQNPEMVSALGINIRRVFAGVFAFGGALAALGGLLAAPYYQTIWPQMGDEAQLAAFIVVVLGGLGSVAGAAVGSVFVGLSQAFVGYYAPELAMAVNVMLMAIVLLVRPQGLMGGKH